MPATSLDQIINLAKRRGFFFPSAEVYGGAGSLIDLGPLGVELNSNLKKLWWQRFVRERDDMVGLDAAIITLSRVLEASGHVANFTDPLVECGNCHIRLRADHYLSESDPHVWILRWKDEAARLREKLRRTNEGKAGWGSSEDEAKATEAALSFFDLGDPANPVRRGSTGHADLTCPNPYCGQRAFGEVRTFNVMFPINLGATEEEGSKAYLRPETAPGIFTNFKLVLDTARKKLPFGIAQIGKAFRNEITTGNSLFRVREFEQAEVEYFVRPGEDEACHEEWITKYEEFLTGDLRIAAERLRRYEHPKEALSHYSKRTVDLEYAYPFGGWGELMGIANRTNYDLSQHQEASGRDLTYFDEETRVRFIPYVIEPSIGLGRLFLTVLIEAYQEYPDGRNGDTPGDLETVLHLNPRLAPVTVAVLPLMKKDGLGEKAREVAATLRKRFACQYDESGAVGRRYRRQDEIGTPYCVTIDYQTLQDGTVTVRDRDSMQQERIAASDLSAHLDGRLNA